MLRVLVARLVFSALVVLLVAICTFGGLRLLRPSLYGGDPVLPGLLRDLERAFLHLDLGVASGFPHAPTVQRLWSEGAAGDLWLLAGALVIGVGGGILAGVWCAVRAGTRRARVVEALATLAYCTPIYVFGLGLLLLFNPIFGAFPVPAFFDAEPAPGVQPWNAPLDWFATYTVPWLVLSAPLGGMCLRITLATMRDELHSDHVRTAVAKGLSSFAVARRHAAPPARVATTSFMGASVPLIVTNMVLVEHVFSVPGFFRHIWRATGHTSSPYDRHIVDFAYLQGAAIWASVLIVSVSLVADLVLARLDPRVRAPI